MANYVGYARTNYFHVKDLAAFQDALQWINVEIVSGRPDGPPQEGEAVAVLSHDEGGWPSEYLTDGDEIVEIDLVDIIAEHLVDGDVAVGLEVGYEKLRYLVGYGWAVNSKGEVRSVSLEDSILALAKELGSNVTGVDH